MSVISRQSFPGAERQRGLALIAVLWGLVLLSVVAASFATTTRTEARLARNLIDNARARALAEAGVQRAALGLLEASPERRLQADGTVYRFAVGGGEVRITIEDESGKIDLNRAPDSLLRGLLLAVGLGEDESTALVDAIADFRDPNDTRRLNGAEDDDYRAAGRDYGAKDRPFEAVGELRQVLGMTPEIYRQVAPALTVHSRRRRVNQAVAPPLVLEALPGLDPSELEARRAGREARRMGREGSTQDIEVIEPVEPDDEGAGGVRRGGTRARSRVVTVRSVARTASGAIFVREAVVRLARRGPTPFRVASWRQGQLRKTVVGE